MAALAAGGLGGGDGPSLARLHCASGLLGHHGLRGHAVLDLCRHGHEGLLNVGGALSRGLEEGDADLVREGLCGGVVDHLLGRQVALVAHEELVHILVGVPIDLVQPLLDVVEALLVRHIINHDDPVRSAVVAGGNGAEALLASGVPDLELDHLHGGAVAHEGLEGQAGAAAGTCSPRHSTGSAEPCLSCAPRSTTEPLDDEQYVRLWEHPRAQQGLREDRSLRERIQHDSLRASTRPRNDPETRARAFFRFCMGFSTGWVARLFLCVVRAAQAPRRSGRRG